MKSKSDVIETIDPSKPYIGSYVIARIKEVDCDDLYPPTNIKKGDVIKTEVGKKIRPCVVIKVKHEKIIALPLTSSDNINNLCESKSRFFRDGYFSNNYVVLSDDYCIRNFIGVYDNMKLLNNAIKELRLFIVKNI